MRKYYDHLPIEVIREAFLQIDTPALDVYRATDLTPSWQQAFRTGRLKDPSYSRTCALVGWMARNHPYELDKQIRQAKVVC